MTPRRVRRTVELTVALLALALVVELRAQDPVKVAPSNYKVILENDDVRVIEVNYKPGDKTPTHSHPDNVAYFLTPAKARFTMADGKTQDRDEKAGTAIWSTAESHAVENTGSGHLTVLLVELKKPAAKDFKGAATPEKEDPAKLTPETVTVLLDNGRVRVLEALLKPGAKEPLHSHPGYVVYALSDGKYTFTTADGKTTEKTLTKGQARWNDPVTHSVVNSGTTDVRVVAIELKPAQSDAKEAPKAQEKKQDKK
jgi:quercetin dioxygenase-like cupin family protein